jgi:membrane protein
MESEDDMTQKNAKTPLQRVLDFVTEGVWDIEIGSLSRLHRFGVKTVRVVHLVVRGFVEDQCPLHAASLTFSTLMSIVPVLAVSLALASGFGAGNNFEVWCRAKAHEALIESGSGTNATVGVMAPSAATGSGAIEGDVPGAELSRRMDKMLEQIFDSVRNVSFAKLGGVGLLILVWSVVQVLGRVESSFNMVWGVAVGRPIHRKVLDYLSVLILVPILAIAASSLPAASAISKFLDPSISAHLTGILGSVRMQGVIVVGIATLAFAFMIMFMPYTRVKMYAGLGGGFVAAILFIVWMQLCIAVQIGVGRYSSIYGTFAAVPIVLFWVYVSWQIILLGAEVAFALQNVSTYRMEMQAHSASTRARFVLALSVIRGAARAMLENEPAFEVAAFAKEKAVSVRLINHVLKELIDAGLLAELSERPGYFVLLKSPDSIKVRDVFNIVFGSGTDMGNLGLSAGGTVGDMLHKTDAGLDAALAGFSAKNLAAQA